MGTSLKLNLLANLLLNFKDSKTHIRYANFVNQRSIKMALILDFLLVFGSILMLSYLLVSIIDSQGYSGMSYLVTIIVFSIGTFVTLIFIIISLWMFYKKRHYSDASLILIYFYSLLFLLEINYNNPELQNNCKLYFSYSYRFGILNLIFINCYRSWIFKAIQLLGTIVYFQVRIAFIDPYDVCYNISITIFIAILCYFVEKNDKRAFQNLIDSNKQNKSWKKIINTLPEGIFIFNDAKKLLFANDGVSFIFNEKNNEKITESLFKLKRGINIPTNTRFSSSSNMINNSIVAKENNNRELILSDVFDMYVAHKQIQSIEKLERQKSFTVKTKFVPQLTMQNNLPKNLANKKKMELFTSKYGEKTLEIKLSSIIYESQQSIIIIINDITEGMRLRMLEDSKAYKNSLFSSFAHEFRTPLNGLFLMSNTLLMQEDIDIDIKNSLIKPIYYNAEMLLNLTNAVSDYTLMCLGTFKLHKKPFKLKEFFLQSIEFLSYLAHMRNIKVEMRFDEDLPEEIVSDESRIKQILFQLYSNALKFTSTGCITTKVKRDLTNPNKIIVSVKDTGIGMTDKDMQNLHKNINGELDYINYEKTSHGSAGASLGLTVSQQIAKKLDFKPRIGIQFKSIFSEGSKFYFSIRNRSIQKKVSYLNLIELTKTVSKGFTNDNIIELKKTISKGFASDNNFDKIKISNNETIPSEELLQSANNRRKFERKYVFKTTIIQENKIKSNICTHEPVIVIDDDEFNIMALTLLLKTKNLKCLSARNGKLAIDLIETECEKRKLCCKKFKIIFMDLNMPIMNGHEASTILSKKFEEKKLPWMPIIVCTAYGDGNIGKIESIFSDYTTKPLKIETLNKILDKWIYKTG